MEPFYSLKNTICSKVADRFTLDSLNYSCQPIKLFNWSLVAWLSVVVMLLSACVDSYESELKNKTNAIVVDATLSTLPGPQIVRLTRAIPDPFTGRFGTVSLTGARVQIKVDSSQIVLLRETEPGRYQAPDGFVGQVGHAYQLQFRLKDDLTQYESDQQLIEPVPPIRRVYAHFNAISLSPAQQLKGGYTAAHDFYVDFNDPVGQNNYYRWDWVLWERQAWCHTCVDGAYQIYRPDSTLLEDCVPYQMPYPIAHYTFDYNCRSSCWEILQSNELILFSDQFSTGGAITAKRVAQIPLYSQEHCLVEIRQSSLNRKAYQYFNQLAQQTQTTGSLVDSPAANLVGNMRSIGNLGEQVIGYFTTSAVWAQRYWLTRSDAAGFAPGLFQAFTGRDPIVEVGVNPNRYRPPLAACVPSDSRTPIKPIGWQD